MGTHHTQNVLERGFGGVLQIVDHEVDERRDGVGPEYHVAHVLVRRQRLQRCRNLHTDPHTTPFVSHQCVCVFARLQLSTSFLITAGMAGRVSMSTNARTVPSSQSAG